MVERRQAPEELPKEREDTSSWTQAGGPFLVLLMSYTGTGNFYNPLSAGMDKASCVNMSWFCR